MLTGVLGAQVLVEPRDSESLKARIESGGDYLLLDVRTAPEFESGHIPTAVNIDYRDIARALTDEDRDREIIVYCRSGSRSNADADQIS